MKEEFTGSRDFSRNSDGEVSERVLFELRKLARRANAMERDPTVISGLEREIALALESLGRTHEMHEEISRRITRSEAAVNTELMQMEARTPKYSPYRFPEREKFHRQLLGLEQEHRRFLLTKHHQLRELYEKLWSLWEKHKVLND